MTKLIDEYYYKIEVRVLNNRSYLYTFCLILSFVLGAFFSNFIVNTFAHGGDINLIHACVNSSGGLRIVGANENCKKNESPLDWSKESSGGESLFGKYPVCPNCDLTGESFTGLDLTRAYFPEAKLAGLNLINTKFTDGRLQDSDFSGANLSQSSLLRVRAGNSNFQNTDLNGANLSESDFGGVNFANSNLLNVNATGVQFGGSNLTNVVFTNANLDGATFGDNITKEQLLSASIITNFWEEGNQNYDGVNFSGRNISGAHLRFTDMHGGNFTNTNMTGAFFDGSDLSGSNMSNANMKNVYFSQTNLNDVTGLITADLTDITWENTICPDGLNSNNIGNTCEGHLNP